MKQKTVYISSRGTEYETLELCVKAERKALFAEILNRTYYSGLSLDELADDLYDYRVDIIKALTFVPALSPKEKEGDAS